MAARKSTKFKIRPWGMRDEFAARAATGLLACYAKHPNQTWPYSDSVAERAYELADAMLIARSQKAEGREP